MKMIKQLLVALALCAPLTVAAQDIEINAENFPDENFRNYVLEYCDIKYWGDGQFVSDGILSAEEIGSIKSVLVGGMNISSLKGLEYFTALEELHCYDNQLTEVDLSANTALTRLNCYRNQLTSLDVSQNTALTYLNCSSNQLTSLDVSKNTALTYLDCSSNQLTSLDVSKNPELETLYCYLNKLTELNVSANPALTKLWCHYNQLTSLDVSKSPALATLYCNDNQFTSLTISNPTLTYLDCRNNQLTTLDVSGSTALEELWCYYNDLTSLDVSANKALKRLICYYNQLTSLDVSANLALTYLSCDGNQLTRLDVSANKALTDLSCGMNLLTALDVSANTALTYLGCNNNQIKGKAMDALINSLSQNNTGNAYVLYIYADSDLFGEEGNIITTSQVAAAKAKGWTPYYYNDGWKEYEGSDNLTSITVAVSADGIATYCPEYDVDFSGTKKIAAYKASVSDNTVTLTRVETVAAGEGVLLRSLDGGAAEEELPIAENATKNTDNAFVGTLTDIILPETDGNVTNFVLSKVNGVIGFFKADNTTVAAGKAYLPVENYNASRSLSIVFDDGTTGISEIAPEQPANDAVYTLGGVRTTKPAKGLYVKNGKKVFIK